MNTYRVIVRTALAAHVCNIAADSTAEAAELAATQFSGVPCGITVKGQGVLSVDILRALITPDFAASAARRLLAQMTPGNVNFVTLSGAVDALPLDTGNRRWATIPNAEVL